VVILSHAKKDRETDVMKKNIQQLFVPVGLRVTTHNIITSSHIHHHIISHHLSENRKQKIKKNM
jgi:hypothetical protein